MLEGADLYAPRRRGRPATAAADYDIVVAGIHDPAVKGRDDSESSFS